MNKKLCARQRRVARRDQARRVCASDLRPTVGGMGGRDWGCCRVVETSNQIRELLPVGKYR
jgi:hypothetical protein